MILAGRNVIVSGGTGFIGRLAVQRLRGEGAAVQQLNRQTGCDLTKWSSLPTITPFDTFVHLAGRSFVPDAFADPRGFIEANTVATLNALELCRLHNARMVFASTYVYGDPQYLPVDEKHPLSAKNPYTESKLIGERLCAAYLRDFGIRSTILRMFNVYGPGQSPNFLIPQLVRQAHTGKIEIADAAPIRDYVFVNDVAEAFVSAVARDERTMSVFNIGTGTGTSVAELVSEILRHVRVPCEVTCLHRRRPGEILATVANVSLAKAELSWEPRTQIAEGIAKSVADCGEPITDKTPFTQ